MTISWPQNRATFWSRFWAQSVATKPCRKRGLEPCPKSVHPHPGRTHLALTKFHSKMTKFGPRTLWTRFGATIWAPPDPMWTNPGPAGWARHWPGVALCAAITAPETQTRFGPRKRWGLESVHRAIAGTRPAPHLGPGCTFSVAPFRVQKVYPHFGSFLRVAKSRGSGGVVK